MEFGDVVIVCFQRLIIYFLQVFSVQCSQQGIGIVKFSAGKPHPDLKLRRIQLNFIDKLHCIPYCSFVFELMFPEILSHETTEHCKKQHEELPEIMCPFSSCSVGV